MLGVDRGCGCSIAANNIERHLPSEQKSVLIRGRCFQYMHTRARTHTHAHAHTHYITLSTMRHPYIDVDVPVTEMNKRGFPVRLGDDCVN